jgi:hypothetical protein
MMQPTGPTPSLRLLLKLYLAATGISVLFVIDGLDEMMNRSEVRRLFTLLDDL